MHMIIVQNRVVEERFILFAPKVLMLGYLHKVKNLIVGTIIFQLEIMVILTYQIKSYLTNYYQKK